jgi:hypothetical protein
MADDSESTPFLTDNDHDQDNNTLIKDPEDDVMKATLTANASFERRVRILTICVSLFSGITTLILIATFVIIQVGPFFRGFSFQTGYDVQALGITVSIIISPYLTH